MHTPSRERVPITITFDDDADDRFAETIATLFPVPPHDTPDIMESPNRASAKTKPLVQAVE